MKQCRACHHHKPVEDYYARQSRCKECTKSAVRANYRRNREHYREYERHRATLPHRVKARDDYAATERGQERTSAAKQSYIDRNPNKRAAHKAVRKALIDGRLVNQPCEVCGWSHTEAHHDDYSKPLDVRWLCKRHHDEHHRKERRAKRLQEGQTTA